MYDRIMPLLGASRDPLSPCRSATGLDGRAVRTHSFAADKVSLRVFSPPWFKSLAHAGVRVIAELCGGLQALDVRAERRLRACLAVAAVGCKRRIELGLCLGRPSSCPLRGRTALWQ